MSQLPRAMTIAGLSAVAAAALPLARKANRAVKAYRILSAVDIRTVNTPHTDSDPVADAGAPAATAPPGSEVV